jgi:hypothetical protein
VPAPILAPFDCPLFDPPEAGRTPAQRGEGDALRPDAIAIRHAKRRESKATPWRRARNFFALRKKPNRLLTRSAPCGLTSVSCPAALSVEWMLPQPFDKGALRPRVGF